jgi:hypothetical protein
MVQAHVRGHPITGFQQCQIAWHQLMRGDTPLLPFTSHGGVGGDELGQGFDRFFRLGFLEEADDCVDQDDTKDDR